MHLFGLSIDAPGVEPAALARELGVIGADFALDQATAWQASSPSGRLHAAGIHHSTEAARPRTYTARSSRSLTLFDGLPVAPPESGLDERDAARLDGRWASLPGILEGQFCAVRLDLQADTAEVLLDPMGLVPVFVARAGAGLVLSNSALALARVLGASDPDGLAVASFVGLGWATERRTLLDRVRALAGGSVHRIDRRGLTSAAHYGPARLGGRERPARRAGRGGAAVAAKDLGRQLVGLTAAARRDLEVECALTGGRDTRLLAALLIASGGDGDYYTDGLPGEPDVELARMVAAHAGLRYRASALDQADPQVDWTAAADTYLARVDGLASFQQLGDHLILDQPVRRLPVKLWGVAGEIGRPGTGAYKPLAANLPLARRSIALQRRLLSAKPDDDGLLTSSGHDLLGRRLQQFVDERLSEGWHEYEVAEAFYVLERVGCWGATGPRRAAATADVFNPFCTRPFIDYCYSLPPGARYVEAPHYRLMTGLAPDLRDLPYDAPWRPQHPRLAGAMATRQLARAVARAAAARVRRPQAGATVRHDASGSFAHQWFEARLDVIREVCLETDTSLWEWIDRRRLEELLSGSRETRAPAFDGLIRIVSVCWFLGRVVSRASASASPGAGAGVSRPVT